MPGTISHIEKLPDEILTECLRHLPITVAKIARLVRHQWSCVIARWLFQRVYFRPQTEFMEIFEAITSNPLFALGISELVYDACQFMPMWSLREIDWPPYYPDIFSKEDLGASEKEWPLILAETRKKHLQLQLNQQRIFDEQIDSRILSTGLQHLPNLKHVSVLETVNYSNRCMNDFPWYSSMAAKFSKSVPPPCFTLDFEGTRQGLRSLMKATSMRNVRLTSFQCGLPLAVLYAESPLTWFRRLFRSLKCLKFYGVRYTARSELLNDSEPRSYLDSETRANLRAFFEGVKAAQDLHHLSLSLGYTTSNDWDIMISGALWPKLTSLDLSKVHLHAAGLVSFCRNHRHTLRELSLNFLYLQTSDTLKSWEDVSKELGNSLRLYYVSLQYLKVDSGEENKYKTQLLLPFVYQIMQWVPNEMLEQTGSLGRTHIFMWYRTKYTPQRIDNDNRSKIINGCNVCQP